MILIEHELIKKNGAARGPVFAHFNNRPIFTNIINALNAKAVQGFAGEVDRRVGLAEDKPADYAAGKIAAAVESEVMGIAANLAEVVTVEPEAKPKRIKPSIRTHDDDLILDPANPRDIARKFLDARFSARRIPTLIHHADQYHAYNGAAYELQAEIPLRGELYTYLDNAQKWKLFGDNLKLVPFAPKKGNINDTLDALAPMVHTEQADPAWMERLADDPDPAKLIVCPSGIWTVRDGVLDRVGDCTPRLWTTNYLPYAIDPDAPVPDDWLAFLDSIVPGDMDAQNLLQEWCAYCLTADTSQQKILMVVGPPRSGKGTFFRVLRRILGEANTCAPSLASIGTNFGLWSFIGKRLAVISDARLSGRTDLAVVTERLLSISGEDPQTIDRKNLQPVTIQLPTRIALGTNELPRLSDSSGALANRFLIVHTPNSFLGKEDTGLTDRLYRGLPGILNWAAAGLVRLHARGHFQQPKSGEKLRQELSDLTSPVGEFVRDVCQVRPAATVSCATLYAAWCGWCQEQGRTHPGPRNVFSRDLRAAVPSIDTTSNRTPAGERVRNFAGIDLTVDGQALAMRGNVMNHTEEGSYGH